MRALQYTGLKMLICSVILAVATPAMSADNSKPLSKAEAGLVAADSARFQAMVAKDAAALELALADELVYIHSSSARQSKSEHLGDIKAGGATYKRLEPKEQVPYIYGDTGIIQGVADFVTGGGNRPEIAFQLRYTSVYVQRQGRWQMVAFSCSRIPPGGVPSGPPPGGAGGPPPAAPAGAPAGGPPRS